MLNGLLQIILATHYSHFSMNLKGLVYPRILFWVIHVSNVILMGMAITIYQDLIK